MSSIGTLRHPFTTLRRNLNFLTAHWLYFISTCLISAIICWGSATPFRSVSFLDSVFLTVSAMTLAGLNTVNLSQLNTFQQFMLFVLMMIGSSIFVSAFVVHVRRRAFEKRFQDVAEKRAKRRSKILGRAKTWGAKTNGNRDEVAIGDDQHDSVEERVSNGHPSPLRSNKNRLDDTLSQMSTPLERRGGPEMNRTSTEPLQHEDKRYGSIDASKNRAITFGDDTRFTTSGQPPTPVRRHTRVFSLQGVGARPTVSFDTSPTVDLSSYPSVRRAPTLRADGKPDRFDITQYFDSMTGWISRNSQFHGLTEHERHQLGGYEYRAVSFLAWIVPLYFILWQLIGAIGCAAWIALNDPEAAHKNDQNAWWTGAFNAVSAFNNAGLSLVDANMVAFQRSYYMLLTVGLLVLAGNTMFPIFLRLIIWCIYKISARFADRGGAHAEVWTARTSTLKFLLDHPRRCYTNLFPSPHTWWLALVVFMLNSVDWAAFEILNLGNDDLNTDVPLRYRVIGGLFQAVAVRSGGFYVFTISTLRISLLVLYVVMMYISVYPVVITMRNSNVYEERSLGIYADEAPTSNGDEKEAEEQDPAEPVKKGNGFLKRAKTVGNHLASLSAAAPATNSEPMNTNFVRHQLRAQLAHDIWFLILALFLIMVIEAPHFEKNPEIYSVFNYIFEIVSAYGTVGLSVGVPFQAYSYCGAWRGGSKLVLCAVMLRGRHRGLPVAIDKAVLLPAEAQARAEEEDGRIRFARSGTKDRVA